MRTLKTIANEIEKKNSSIRRISEYLNQNPNSSISSQMRKSRERYENEKQALQVELDEMYNKYNLPMHNETIEALEGLTIR